MGTSSHTEENPAAVREEMCLDKLMETRVTLQQEEDGEDTSRNAGASTAEEKQNEQHSVSGAQSPETRSHVIADTAESYRLTLQIRGSTQLLTVWRVRLPLTQLLTVWRVRLPLL